MVGRYHLLMQSWKTFALRSQNRESLHGLCQAQTDGSISWHSSRSVVFTKKLHQDFTMLWIQIRLHLLTMRKCLRFWTSSKSFPMQDISERTGLELTAPTWQMNLATETLQWLWQTPVTFSRSKMTQAQRMSLVCSWSHLAITPGIRPTRLDLPCLVTREQSMRIL